MQTDAPEFLALARLFEAQFGRTPTSILPLAPSGSKRKYFRLISEEQTAVGTYHHDRQENRAFTYFTKHFETFDLPVPKLFQEDLGQSVYLQEDLGDRSLYQLLPAPGQPFTEELIGYYKKVVQQLARLQVLGGKNLDTNYCYPKGTFNAQAMYWDMQYFKYYYLKLLDFPYDEYDLERDFRALAGWLEAAGADHFMMRDCQSRNILLFEGEPYFIDYQGGRPGPLQYDLVSLLWQAKANLPNELRESLLEEYLGVLQELIPVDLADFRRYYYGFVLIRSLQVLGVYGLRGLVQRKKHFIQSIPYALATIHFLLENDRIGLELPALRLALKEIVEAPPTEVQAVIQGTNKPLVVSIQSFSYKRGIPEDQDGHGGGFVFDCRGIHNPGRYEPYKKLTGRDPEVQAFLKHESEMDAFLENVYDLVDRSVQTYLERDFESLTVSFGCTGGQHRSVYAGDQLAAHLKEKFDVRVRVHHREQELKNWQNN